MELTIDPGRVTALIGCMTALCGIFAGLFRLWARFRRLEKHDSANRELLVAMLEAQFATLDGLKQLGANGEVTKAQAKLRDTVIKAERGSAE